MSRGSPTNSFPDVSVEALARQHDRRRLRSPRQDRSAPAPRLWRGGLVAALLLGWLIAVAEGQQQPPPSFRSQVTVVPIDVRVLDRDGNPITDLTQADFTITENSVPQAIRYFSTHSLTEGQAGDSPLELRRAHGPDDLATQNRRVFLIVMGRGHMTGPSKELPALEQFLKSRLLPQDRVAILAYNRGTDITTDHEGIRSVVERYRERHERIETALEQYFDGLQGLYGSKKLPDFLQGEIDAVFGGSARAREITPGQISGGRQMAGDIQRTAENLQRAEVVSNRTGEFANLPDLSGTSTANRMDLSFDEYIAQQVELLHDVSNLYAGIDYLRYLDGEKHLVFLTPQGVGMPRLENDRSLAAVASDARVALDIIYVAGAPVGPKPRVTPDGKIDAPVLPTTASIFGQTATVSDMRVMSEMTGGQLTAFRSADYAFSHLDRATRFEYLLGYIPSNAASNGAFRKISVTVKRAGATVLYRQGYYSTPQLVPLDRQAFITFNRMSAAGRYQGAIEDIRIELNLPTVGGTPNALELLVAGTIRSPRIKFTEADGYHRASLDLGVYAGNGKEQPVGELQRKVDLNLREDRYRAFAEQGASFNIRVPVSDRPKYVKVIVYDYASDLLGSATVTVK